MRHLLLALLMIGFVPGVALGGGTDWLFRVVAVRTDANDCAVIQLEPVEAVQEFPTSCRSFEVLSCYHWPWWRPNKPVSVDQHNQAIGFLCHAEAMHTPIRFGSMGEGFGNIVRDEQCRASSSALQIIDNKAVYSYFKWP
jgi:hypothetical protein